MRSLLPRPRVLVFGAIAIGSGLLLGTAGWPQPDRTSEFGGLIFAAILASSLATPKSATGWGTMPLSFVVEFTSLLRLGPNAALLVAAAGTGTRGLSEAQRPQKYFRMLMAAAIVMASTQAAGFAHQVLGGTTGHFAWPWQGVPIGAAVVAYCLMKSALAEVMVPLCARQPVNRSWANSLLRNGPSYFIGASLAVGVVEVIDHQVWEVLPVAIVPLFFAYRAYCAQLNQLEEEQRRREVIDALNQGMSVLDGNGVVTLWNDTLEHILECPRNRALNHTLAAAVPALAKTELPKAIAEVLAARNARTLPQLAISCASGLRVLQVRILPVPDGVTLLWHDVTELARAEQALKRSEERLSLAAEGANDGLWEWDLRTQEFFFSGRWREMLGLPATASIGRPNEWIERVHPDDTAALKAALAAPFAGTADHFQHEHRIRHEDGTYRRFLCRGVAVRGAGRRSIRLAGSLTDTTEQAIAQERLRNAGFLDPLTGLCNRAVFVEGLGRRLTEFKEQLAGSRFAVLYLDLDRFKVVNDSLGHLVGDELLTAVARRLESCLRPGDALARLGGDEFAILLSALGDEAQANVVAFRIQKALSAPFSIGGREVFTSASIGIAFGRAQYTNPEEIMRDADVAMYHAKSGGKARHDDMHARALDRLGLENDLRHAVKENDFEVHYQPIVLLDSGRCVGFESLIRWTRNGRSISPATFVPIAEELGLIESVGTFVLQQACSTFAEWQRRFPESRLDYITVNVSSRQLAQQNFLGIVEQALDTARLKPRDLRLEITETALMDNPATAAALLQELRDFGVKIYLDDFGTGYSSLSHLHKLPVDALKIDRSFVKSLLMPDRPAIVESILALARTMNTSVVAEGIESEVQWRELERLGCTHAQGYLFSKPLSTRAIEALLVANQPLGPKRTEAEAVAATGDAVPVHSSASLEWPAHVSARPVAAAATHASTPRASGDTLRA
jgi:diguanylate cyclase (GGDEF)-like protein/PAS domain S-box-containing protein